MSMAIRIDPALQAMPRRLQDEFRHELAGTRRGPIADAVLPLNTALLDRQARIDTLTRQVKQADERGDEAMRRAHVAEAKLTRLTEWMAEHALLHYHKHCKRPDGTSGPAWVVRNPAVVDGSSCEAWHAKSAAGAVEAWLSEKATG
jgi:hypothetical protein